MLNLKDVAEKLKLAVDFEFQKIMDLCSSSQIHVSKDKSVKLDRLISELIMNAITPMTK